MTRFDPNQDTLADWLTYIESCHPESVDLGLDRVRNVRSQLKLEPLFPIITVGGTNGKGSVCAILETILSYAGYRVGCYTSPHFFKFNERIRINSQEVNDFDLFAAFEEIDEAAKNSGISLTYFEYGTLAAMLMFAYEKVDIAILEVGLGGRLDAVNLFDADCAILTSIGLDHMNYLGDTREKIGFEKANIFRSNKAAVCAELNVPAAVKQYAKKVGACFLQIGEDFGFITQQKHWDYWDNGGKRHCLPYPALRGPIQVSNASASLAALRALENNFPVNMSDIRQGLLDVYLPGRFQIYSNQPLVILDVAHNPDAANILADNLDAMPSYRHTYGVFAMLNDKDITGVIKAVKHCIDIWLISTINTPRGARADELQKILNNENTNELNKLVYMFPDPDSAFRYACAHATNNDRICVLGSFYTVSAALQTQKTKRQGKNQELSNDRKYQ